MVIIYKFRHCSSLIFLVPSRIFTPVSWLSIQRITPRPLNHAPRQFSALKLLYNFPKITITVFSYRKSSQKFQRKNMQSQGSFFDKIRSKRILRCQNMFTKLTICQFIIICFEIHSQYCVPKIIVIIIQFGYMQLSVSINYQLLSVWLYAITSASFSRYSGNILQV